jgi:hypothetical protein
MTIKNIPVNDEAIRWAYRILLGRDPENEQDVESKRRLANVDQFMDAISNSPS